MRKFKLYLKLYLFKEYKFKLNGKKREINNKMELKITKQKLNAKKTTNY